MSEEALLKPRRFFIAAFEGWNDACAAATNVIHHLLNLYHSREVATIESEGYYDYQVARPMLCHVQGRRSICWPETKFYDLTVDDYVSLVLEVGPEPNYNWRDFTRRSLRLAEDYDVDGVITLGSMFADCPHTRELPVDDLAGDELDKEQDGHSGPVGIPTVLDSVAAEAGFQTESIWVSVPQYLGSDECSQGTLQLLRKVSAYIGRPLREADLPQKAKNWRAQASVLTRCNDDLAQYVHHLELESDKQRAQTLDVSLEEPAAKELVREAEEFLKSVGGTD